MMYSNEAQKEQWLRPLAQGKMLGAFALTEPHTGSDASALRTTATRDGDHYVLNGTKQFITSGKNGDVAIVMAVTDKAAGKKGISAFWVPTDTPGYIVAGLEHKMGQHSSDTAQILLDNCRIPAENLIGVEGQGYKIALAGIEAARQLIWHAASMKDAGLPCLKEAAMAKLFASEMAERVVSDAMQVFGGYGYVSDFPIERIYRDVRVCQIYEGTSDIQKILIARAL